jgi:hypothetical protein
MSSDSQFSNPSRWDWPSWMKGSMPNPLDVFAAPRNLVQPILPGWVFGSVPTSPSRIQALLIPNERLSLRRATVVSWAA